MFGIGTIDDWAPVPGSVVSWHPSAAALAKARQAPISGVPASYQQAQHLRRYCEQAALGLDYSRLIIATCDGPGRCDIRAMTYVINAHLRRHTTYRSWFEYQDAEPIIRHTIDDPADIEFVPTEHGEMTPAELRDHILATPDPLQWDCFRFGVIQGTDRHTVFACVDHLHADAQFLGVGVMEFQMMYLTLITGGAPLQLPEAGSYDDYCVRQHEYTSALTLDSPQVRAWIEFAENNNGTVPEFPLPLGDPSVPCKSELLTVTLMDEHQTARFESACFVAGARFIGGVFACAALAEHELTGADTYYGLTPIDTRSTPVERMTQGWFTGWIPVTVPIAGSSFGEAARAAQESFDSGTDLAHVPFDRVLELAPWLSRPRPLFPMLNFFDAGIGPLSPLLTSPQMEGVNLNGYNDGRFSYQLSVLLNRINQTTVTVVLPNNPVARESVTRYVEAMKSMFIRLADGCGADPLPNYPQLRQKPA